MKSFSIVVAATKSNNGIGMEGNLPWKIPADMKHFKNITCGDDQSKENVVIMGRKTYESIPEKFRPLPNRKNIVLSRNADIRSTLKMPESVVVADSLTNALEILNVESASGLQTGEVFVIGGQTVYAEAMAMPQCAKIYLTQVLNDGVPVDTFLPSIPADRFRMNARSAVETYGEWKYRFTEYESFPDDDSVFASAAELTLMQRKATGVNLEEQAYLDIIKDIMANGVVRGDRTGTGTISKFGVQMRFNLRDDNFPLLTTKKVFWRGVAEELIWFVHGRTNGKELSDKKIHIWDGNGSREFLDSRGLSHREEGDLGPVYGFQWRHFGAEYKDMHADYTGQGVDQLLECIHKIKNTPEDRRIVLTAWNPADLDKMALPPCHMFCQFYVANGEVSCQMYQRSADMGLGVPFNIASYSLLTAMVAQACGLKPGDFVHTIGDAHVYLNHIDALQEQIKRVPRTFPKLRLNPEITDIDAFQYSDFTIEGYKPDALIKMKMAV